LRRTAWSGRPVAAHAFAAGTGFEVDFDLAVTRHKLIDVIERSAAEERVVQL
jgi:hypothetical protein